MKDFKRQEFTFEALYKAYLDCRKHKGATAQAIKFDFRREKNLYELYEEILSGNYEVGRSICFIVTEPKLREVWAGSFRDRIVHHLIYNAVYDRFVSKFIYDTYSCIPKRGTLKGAQRAARFSKNITQNYSKDAYYIKMDIRNYFVSIDKKILCGQVLELVDEPWLVELIKKVIFHNPKDNVAVKSPKWLSKKLPLYKSLFNADDIKGLPIGNLTSQFFSNVYLNPLDQFVKHTLKCKYYLRYVDDILIIDKDAGFLNYAYSEINKFLIDNLALELNHRKKNINLVNKGFDFVGHVIKPNRIHIRTRTAKKCRKTIKDWNENPDKFSEEELKKFRNKINSYYGMLRHVDGYNFRKEISRNTTTLFTRADDKLTKLIVN